MANVSTQVLFIAILLYFQHVHIQAFVNFKLSSISRIQQTNNYFQSTNEDLTDIESRKKNRGFNNQYDEIISEHLDELIRLRQTPELVDKLENMVLKYPGIEMDMNLYRAIYPFPLDKFQEDGLLSLMSGNSVLVSTPTGSGKTVVGELAIYFALMLGLKVAYTTPLKALSNQKYQDFRTRYGGDRVGLLTGDIAINRGAPVTIMTTEVFRNMIYDADSTNQLSSLFMVCFDEFHYMNDPDRGTVWEECVISAPPSVRILALSATMGNVEEIKGWMTSIHGPTDLILSNHRPVPLRYLFALKQGLMPIFRDPNAGPGSLNGITRTQGRLDVGSALNPSIIKLEELAIKKAEQLQQSRGSKSGGSHFKVSANSMIPKYSDLIDKLQRMDLLPAIVFIFSRVGCEDSAKELLQAGLKLLTPTDVQYVSQAVNAFASINPEIPISKSSIMMLKAGVGVHHAGLIPVWKAFVEDLFNANKIKVLFATETLAAGVNMPARTTIISTVTKRVNSEIVKLKTSQLLQMAGRAGRRGKDTEGTVVVVRNRFEEPKISHKIFTSPVDSIKSHFKTSYGLAIKLLESRSLEECKSLIEKGFGSYLLQQRVKKKEKDIVKQVEDFREVLQKYTLKGARDYFKIIRRLEKEKRNEEFLVEKMLESESELVQAIADYMPLGAGLLLRNGDSGFFLGDVKWGQRNENGGFGVITRTCKLLIVQKEHIRAFSEGGHSISPREASHLLDLVSLASDWVEMKPLVGCKSSIYESAYCNPAKFESQGMLDALVAVRGTEDIPVPPTPGSVLRQKMIVDELLLELENSVVTKANDGELVIQALQYVTTVRDPTTFVNAGGGNAGMNVIDGNDASTVGDDGSKGDVYAWRMFQNVMKILQQFGALEGSQSTELGSTVSSLTGDNELWLATVLQSQHIQQLSEAELGAVMAAVVTDGHKASSAFIKYQASPHVQEVYDELDRLSWELKLSQSNSGLEFPVSLCREVGGLAESWINGISWRELCKDTSLDQGDLCRILRRTVEILRQIPQAYGLQPGLVATAQRAAYKMDRFPVAEMDVQTGELKDTSGVGFGFGVGAGVVGGDVALVDINIDGDDSDAFDTDTDNGIAGSSSSFIDKVLSDAIFNDAIESIELEDEEEEANTNVTAYTNEGTGTSAPVARDRWDILKSFSGGIGSRAEEAMASLDSDGNSNTKAAEELTTSNDEEGEEEIDLFDLDQLLGIKDKYKQQLSKTTTNSKTNTNSSDRMKGSERVKKSVEILRKKFEENDEL